MRYPKYSDQDLLNTMERARGTIRKLATELFEARQVLREVCAECGAGGMPDQAIKCNDCNVAAALDFGPKERQ